MAADDLPVVEFAHSDAWDAWLRVNHAEAPGAWIKMAKKASGIPSVSWQEAVVVALTWGWIDGQRKGLDDTHFLQRFTPRRARSIWSKVNVGHVERLEAEGRMHPAGMAQVEAARADGRWEAAYSSVASREVPPELQAALDASPAAATAFAGLNSSNRYAMCFRIQTAKRAETKARNVEKFIAMLERGERLH